MRQGEGTKLGISVEDRKQYASLTIVKNNYGPSGEIIWFKRISFDSVGLLEFVKLSPKAKSTAATADLETKVTDFVATHPGQYAKTRFRDTHSGKKGGPFKASKGELERTIENLIREARLLNRAKTNIAGGCVRAAATFRFVSH
jgi:hypothetical protein